MEGIKIKDPSAEVVLICSTGEEMEVPRHILCQSKVLEVILSDPVFSEAVTGRVHLPITRKAMERVVQYLQYKKRYHEKEGDIEDFVIEEQETLDLLEVSAFLRI